MSFKKIAYRFLSYINYYFLPVNLNRFKKVRFREAYYVPFTAPEEKFLKSCAETFNFSPDYSLGYLQKPLFTIELANATFLGNSGALILQKKILAESVFDQVRMSISPAYRFPAYMRNRRKKGFYTSVVHLPWAHTSNYHWFFDCLPRLYLLVKTVNEPVTLILNAGLPTFQLETLQLIIKDNSNFSIEYISKYEKWTVDRFIFASFVTNHNSGYLPEQISHYLREKIWQGYQVAANSGPARLYISRKKATKRKILNEPELETILVGYHFKIIFAEDFSYQEQVRMFYTATHVVAPHGAGLTNILFSQKCSVLELHAADVIKSHYFLTAKSLGHTYDYLIGSVSDEKFNFTVDAGLFAQKLRSMLEK